MGKVNILAIGAHPDDIEFGCGGTLIKYSQKGHRLFLLVMTEGGSGAQTATRKTEQQDSKEILGAEKIYWGGCEDTHLIVEQELSAKSKMSFKKYNRILFFAAFPTTPTRTIGILPRPLCPLRGTFAMCCFTKVQQLKISNRMFLWILPIRLIKKWRRSKRIDRRS